MKERFGVCLASLVFLAPLAVALHPVKVRAADDTVLQSLQQISEFKDQVGLYTANPPTVWPQVTFESVVIYSDPIWNYAFVQDNGHAVFVFGGNLSRIRAGSRVSIQGIMRPGDLLPIVEVWELQVLSTESGRPEASPVDLAQLDYGQYDSEYVMGEATVLQVFVQPRRTTLFCRQGHTHFFVSIAEWGIANSARDYLGQRLRFRGALGLHIDSHAFARPGDNPERIFGFHLHCSSIEDVEIVGGKSDALPNQLYAEVNVQQLKQGQIDRPRFLTHGQINLVDRDSRSPSIVLGDDFAATRIPIHSGFRLNRGMVVRVGGWASSDGNPLQADFIQLLGHGELPKPTRSSIAQVKKSGEPFHRYSISGTPQYMKPVDDEIHLTIRNGHDTATIVLEKEAKSVAKQVDPDVARLVSVSGILLPPDNHGDVKLIVSSAQDVELLEEQKFPLHSIAALLLLLGSVSFWSWLLRRQVSQKTRHLRQMAAQLRSSYEAVDEGILVVDLNQCVIAVNQEFCRIVGKRIPYSIPAEHYLNQFASRLLSEPAAFRDQMQICQEDTTHAAKFKIEVESPDYAMIDVATSPIRMHENGEPIARLWIFRDETEKRQLEIELIRSSRLQAIGQLAGGVAHDFNNILAAITSNLTVAQINPDVPVSSVQSELTLATDAAYRGADVSRRLLCFSAENSLNLEPSSVNDLISNLGLLIRHSFDSSIEFSFDLDNSNPTCVIDSAAIEQVLMNLYVNARDAISGPGFIATRTSTMVRNEQSYLQISVSDSGSGVPVSVREKIFDPFFSTKNPDRGTGLGLSMSYRVVQQHGGRLWLASEPGQTTEFVIELPTCDKPLTVDTWVDSPTQVHSKALVVDDEDAVRTAAAQILETRGMTVLQAGDGEQALEILADNQDIGVVLLDLTMPGMPGHVVLDEIKTKWPWIPVVVCSGYILDNRSTTGVGQPDATIGKPYTVKSLFNTLQSVMPQSDISEQG